jgi:DNA repair exonuclease SbcCD ATPase subunit
MCYDNGFIDFTAFNAALIVGKVENNDLYSNGVGKTTIFKSIEYVLFNQAEVNLEKIVRDDIGACQIAFDFIVDDKEYRIIRKRTKKGSTDLSLYERLSAVVGPDEEVLHTIIVDGNREAYTPISEKKYWKDLSGRRSSDTEKELEKLIKINYKAFRSTIHFIQNDFSGIATVTPEKRKGILKEALNLVIYTKLEKTAKELYNNLCKDADKRKVLLENLGNPQSDLDDLSKKLKESDLELSNKNIFLSEFNDSLKVINDEISLLNNEHSNLENKFSTLLEKDNILNNEKNRIEISVKEYQSKKNNVIKSAKELINEISSLKENQIKLVEKDYSQIDLLTEEINHKREQIAVYNANIQNQISKYEELKIPMPKDALCKHCRQSMSDKHRKDCVKQIDQEISACQISMKDSKKAIDDLNKNIIELQNIINDLQRSKQRLEDINTKIAEKNKEVQDKKTLHMEYGSLLDKFILEAKNKLLEIESNTEQLNNSSLKESKNVKEKINIKKQEANSINSKILVLNKEITHFNNNRAVIQHTIDQKVIDVVKQKDLNLELEKFNKNLTIYPSVLQAFSSTGIPNLIIQNVLDDLQIEANNLLSQLKPGLQLSFFVEKTQGDGTEADTLDIMYHINGKERYYEQLSGAMRLAVTFSLKLGLSFLLQKIIGTDIRFLLLDEIDQSLDKASVDAFADIVKFFQKDFNILIITHNDRLKDKFSHAVLVEQDINMVSRAKVVSSW